MDFALMEVVHDWRMSRSEFLQLSEEDRAWMSAYTTTKARMHAVEMQEQERELDRVQARGK